MPEVNSQSAATQPTGNAEEEIQTKKAANAQELNGNEVKNGDHKNGQDPVAEAESDAAKAPETVEKEVAANQEANDEEDDEENVEEEDDEEGDEAPEVAENGNARKRVSDVNNDENDETSNDAPTAKKVRTENEEDDETANLVEASADE